MNLVSMRLITDDIKRLVGFYEEAIGLSPKWYTEDYAELATPSCTLAIASKRSMDLFGAGAARSADNHSAILEFRVDDVDKELKNWRTWSATLCSGRRPSHGETALCCFATRTET